MNKYDRTAGPVPGKYNRLVLGALKTFTRLNVFVYRASNGRLMNRFPDGTRICLVTMTGRRTGRKRTVPLIHVPNGEQVILIASLGGMDRNPLWYYNIVANPELGITAKGITRRMIARQASDEEKARVWPIAVGVYARFDDYQARTERNIPVFICSPAA
ncbi:MAG: nitroreductase family deazaflavin-dependent oxidoreductase [Pseudomonadales bacterium]|nr:nitroreductase family deazaflavin-dependent oxidoreductase [Pseudomonadales bacterium]